MLDALDECGVTGSTVHVVDNDVRPGVLAEGGDGDEWLATRRQTIDADIPS